MCYTNTLLSDYIYLEPEDGPLRPKHVAPFSMKVVTRLLILLCETVIPFCYLYSLAYIHNRIHELNIMVAVTKLQTSRSQKIVQRCNMNSGAQASENSSELAAYQS
jgi:hypothetical protein